MAENAKHRAVESVNGLKPLEDYRATVYHSAEEYCKFNICVVSQLHLDKEVCTNPTHAYLYP